MITILFFASAKEAAGTASRTIDASPSLTLTELSTMLCREYPLLAPLMPSMRFAVNQSLAAGDRALADGDEVAVLPPVSGG